jgi:putative ABC transport system ATP-binding protein
MTRAIDILDLSFRYPKAPQDCLKIASFQVEAGERIFLHGASGSGKSTLLGLIGGVLQASQGAVKVLGNDLVTMRPALRDRLRADHLGFIFQQFNLIPYLSVMDNVLLPCRFSAQRKQRAGTDLQQEARRLLAHLQLEGVEQTPVTQLSVGQQQRVAAARALMGRPEIIIADEPTSSLDSDRQAAFLELLLQECTAANAALIFVSHDRRLATHFHREIALLDINQAATQEISA